MPTTNRVWPTHGRAKDARDVSAEKAQVIYKQASDLIDLKHAGRLSEMELMYRLSQILRESSDILRLLEEQGAPTRPTG